MNKRFYNFIWRWHLYAGLIVSPFMIILAISGSIYLFKPQLDRVLYSSLTVVPESQNSPLTETVLMQKLQSQYSGYKIQKYFSPLTNDGSARFDLASNQGMLSVFLNPFTGEHLGSRLDKDYVQTIAKKIHGELIIGTFGDYLVELMACWGLILVITGLYLVFPNNLSSLKSLLLLNIAVKKTRWRNIHTTAGFYGSLLILFLILSGLPWTGFWGDKILHSWDQYPDKMYSNIPKSQVLNESLNKNIKVIPWAVEKNPLPLSTGNGAAISLSEVTRVSLISSMTKPFIVSFPQGPKGVFTVSAVTGNPQDERVLHLDQYNAKVLTSISYKYYSPVAASIQYGIALHEGKLFGVANQLLAFFACLMLIFISISGIVLWWKRKPTIQLDKFSYFLKLNSTDKFILTAVVLITGVIFPLLGLSLAVIWIVELIYFKIRSL